VTGSPIFDLFEHLLGASALLNVEPMTGIEPAYSAWEADVLPLNYIGLTSLAGDHEG
jgi:hypothetical protein